MPKYYSSPIMMHYSSIAHSWLREEARRIVILLHCFKDFLLGFVSHFNPHCSFARLDKRLDKCSGWIHCIKLSKKFFTQKSKLY